MKILARISVVALFVLTLFFVYAPPVDALSTSWNTVVSNTLKYHWNFGTDATVNCAAQGVNFPCITDPYYWSDALQNPNITITYGADVYDRDTGSVITPGSTIGVGTRLEFRPKNFEDTDIYWFGTGFSQDSPYGHWQSGSSFPPESNVPYAGPIFTSYQDMIDTRLANPGDPAYEESEQERDASQCLDQDFLTSLPSGIGSGTIEVFIPLSVSPPSVNVNHSGSAGLSCNGNNRLCTVTSPGSINTSFVFSGTQGKFYYRYDDSRFQGSNIAVICGLFGCGGSGFVVNNPHCTGNNEALRLSTGGTAYSRTLDKQHPAVSSSDYILSVPQRTINFTATAAAVNQPPNPPTIDGPTTGVTGTSYSFTFTATDPDNDTIRYGVDWNNNGTVNQWVPTSYVGSGQSRSTTRSWGTVGTYTFKARTQDVHGALSGWTTHTITISPSTPPVTGSCSASPASIQTGESTTWSASPSGGTGSYTYSWSGTDSLSGTTQNIGKTYITAGNKTASVSITSGSDNTNVNCSTTVVVTQAPPLPQCSDGVNNDGDSWTDYPNDPGCTSANDDSESPNPHCSDGIDNDGDGQTDYPADSDCSGNGGTSEGSGPQPNQAPNAPNITGPTSGLANSSYSFGFSATDPDGDDIRYRIDWNPNSSTDQNLPSSGYVSSGNSRNTSRSWSTAGTYQFRALTEDDQGAASGYTTHTITIVAPECSDGSDNDGDSFVDYPSDPGCFSPSDDNEFNAIGNPSLSLNLAPEKVVRSGDRVRVSWSAQNVQSCTVSGTNGNFWTGTSGNRNSSPITEETVFTLTCTDLMSGQVSVSETIRILPSFQEI